MFTVSLSRNFRQEKISFQPTEMPFLIQRMQITSHKNIHLSHIWHVKC